uniref:RxLR effector candidate protein n=1 Tax=Hyaloperonospora arabidopsidis (strain Emoy2) TaxID=559515 RepID=A0A090B862_HYAAE|nr:RxLR effector candidate protein [Hyaloperonospora arabidopsidis Emoy2]
MRSFYLFALAVSGVLLVLVGHASGLEGLEARASSADVAEDTNGVGRLTAAHEKANHERRALFSMENPVAMLTKAIKWLKDKLYAFCASFSRSRKIKNEGVTHDAGAIAHEQQNGVDQIARRFQEVPPNRHPAVVNTGRMEPVDQLYDDEYYQPALNSLLEILSNRKGAVAHYQDLLKLHGHNRGSVAQEIYHRRMEDKNSATLQTLELEQFAFWIAERLKYADVLEFVKEAGGKNNARIAKLVADHYVLMISIAMDIYRNKPKL